MSKISRHCPFKKKLLVPVLHRSAVSRMVFSKSDPNFPDLSEYEKTLIIVSFFRLKYEKNACF